MTAPPAARAFVVFVCLDAFKVCFPAAIPSDDFTAFILSDVNSYRSLWTLTCREVLQHTEPCVPHRADRHAAPPLPSTLLVYTCLVSCPQTLTAAGAEVWVGAHYSLAEPCQKEGRVFLKGVNWGFLFWVTLFRTANPTPCVVWSVPCVVCVPPAVSSGPFTLEITSAPLDLMNSPPVCSYCTEITRICL